LPDSWRVLPTLGQVFSHFDISQTQMWLIFQRAHFFFLKGIVLFDDFNDGAFGSMFFWGEEIQVFQVASGK
jgi:hypothetical protein